MVTNDENRGGGDLAEIVILIHGTGAGIANKESPRWWQTESKFARKLSEYIGNQCRVSDPFLWGEGGANSELARRDGGEKLYAHLAALEQNNIAYHLVAHSHGGSVVWHALVQSARQRAKLHNLKSWTTVGTPFLEFGPDPMALWQAVGLVSTTAAFALLWSSISTFFAERSVVFAEGNLWALGGVASLGIVLAALWLFFLFRILLLAKQFSAARVTKAGERQAAKWYGDKWLCLWHDRDEPISGLQASLSEAPELVPRLAKPPRPLFLRVLLVPYDWLAAPVGDAFAWAAIMGKLQGSDVIGNVMVSAGSAPPALVPGWPPLFASLATLLKSSADTRAGASAGRLRDALAAAAKESSGQAALTEIAKIIGWDELIHTSYFDAQGLDSVIASRIANEPLPADVPDDFRRLPSANGTNTQYRHRSFRLAVASAAFVGALTLVLGGAFNAAYRSAVEPLTNAFQISAIAEVYGQRRIMGAADGRAAGNLLVRLYSAGALPLGSSKKPFAHDVSRRIFGSTEGMPREEQRFAALQVFFFHLGAQGRDKDLGNLFTDIQVALDETRNDKFDSILAISAELGYAAAGKPATPEVLLIADKILQVSDQSETEGLSTEVVLPYLIRRRHLEQALDLTKQIVLKRDKGRLNCYRALFPLVLIWASNGEGPQAVAIAEQCEENIDRFRLTLEAVAALTRRGGQTDIKTAMELLRATEGKNSLLSSEAPGWHIPGVAMLLVLENRMADAKNYILRGLNDVIQDARMGGHNGLPDVLSAADEMARRGHLADSREIILRVIESRENSSDPETFALKLKAGLVTKDQVRSEARSAMAQAESGDRPFGVAKDAALSASLYGLVDASKEAQEALVLAINALPRLQPLEERMPTLLAVTKLMNYLDRGQIDLLSTTAAVIADQQAYLENGDVIFRAISPSFTRDTSLLGGRRMAEQIVSVDVRLKAYAALLDVFLSADRPNYNAKTITDDKLPATVAMNTALPPNLSGN